MDLNDSTALAILAGAVVTAIVVTTALCWLAWRWRKHTVTNREWADLGRREKAVLAQSERMRADNDGLRLENDLLPLLRATLNERDLRNVDLQKKLQLTAAREVGADARIDQLSAEIEALKNDRRSVDRELANADERARQAEATVVILRDDQKRQRTGTAPTRAADVPRSVDLREADAVGGHSDVERLERMLSKRTALTAQLQDQVEQLRARADASAVQAADLRSRLDAQTAHAGHLERQIRLP